MWKIIFPSAGQTPQTGWVGKIIAVPALYKQLSTCYQLLLLGHVLLYLLQENHLSKIFSSYNRIYCILITEDLFFTNSYTIPRLPYHDVGI